MSLPAPDEDTSGQPDAPRRRHILFLTPQLPYPPEQGAAIRNYGLISQTATRHDVGLLSFGQLNGEARQALGSVCIPLRVVAEPERSLAQRLSTLLLDRTPDMAHRLWSPAYADALHSLLSAMPEIDTVQIEGIEMAPYGDLVRRWRGTARPAIVFDDHNAEYILQRRAYEADCRVPRRWHAAAYSWVQYHRLTRYERQVCLRAEGVVAVSETDAQALRALSPAITPLVVPNGVDVQRYRPGLGDALGLCHPAVVFTGRMDFRPNVDAILWFHRAIWSRIRAEEPEAHLYVVGKAPHRTVVALGTDPSVTVTGYVQDILPYFGGADVYVVPLRMGGGTRLKVLEAMACGLPLVSTTIGAEGIARASGEQLFLADDAEGFARAVTKLLRDAPLRASVGRAARGYVARHYDWRAIVPRFEPLYASL